MTEVRWHGRGGQGSFTVARMLGAAAVSEGKFAQAFPSFGPERRGAAVTGFTRIDTKKILNRSEAVQPDYVVVMDEALFGPAVTEGIKMNGVIVINTASPEKYPDENSGYRIVTLDATSLALAALGRPIANVAMVAALVAALVAVSGIVGMDAAETAVRESLSGFAGDGGTADIGLQALSGAIDRGDRITYICYDNEAYMNTGVQKSGLTPYGTKTTTSPAGHNLPGSVRPKKNLFEIVAAHDIPYAATASVGYPQDYLNKLEKAKNTPGTSFIHVLALCPIGWGSEAELTVELWREAVDTGLWVLAEYEDGQYSLTMNPKEFLPIRNYLGKQGRFKHLTDKNVAVIEKYRDNRWAKIRSRWQLPGGKRE